MRAAVAGITAVLLLAVWLAGAMLLGDRLMAAHWAVRLVFYAVAGFVWVLPVRWLLLWAARSR